MKKTINFLLLVFIGISLSTCTYNNEQTLYPVLSNSCDTTNITFSGKVAPIFKANCLSCHGNAAVAAGNGGGVKLEDYSDVKANLNRAYGSMAHLPGYVPMPKNMSGTIDTCQIKIVRIWKAAGAPDN
jgi:hypothetical protein